VSEPTHYLDTFHTTAMAEIKDAFEEFNSKLLSIHNGGIEAEALDIVVTSFGDPYVRCFYLDGETFIEPIYNPLREIGDR
jgi:hypothetical protein